MLRAWLATTLLACASQPPDSSAADVSNEDVRRLTPARKSVVPDVMQQAADRSRVIGAEGARVQIFVISDYQCAECRAWYSTVLPELRRLYLDTGAVRLTWVHYPLRTHPNTVRAASAALCAGAQGNDKFWAASTRLFERQAQWLTVVDPSAILDSLMLEVGVEPFALRSCTSSRRMFRQIRADIDWVDRANGKGPLTVMIGSRRIADGGNLASVRSALDSALALAR